MLMYTIVLLRKNFSRQKHTNNGVLSFWLPEIHRRKKIKIIGRGSPRMATRCLPFTLTRFWMSLLALSETSLPGSWRAGQGGSTDHTSGASNHQGSIRGTLPQVTSTYGLLIGSLLFALFWFKSRHKSLHFHILCPASLPSCTASKSRLGLMASPTIW